MILLFEFCLFITSSFTTTKKCLSTVAEIKCASSFGILTFFIHRPLSHVALRLVYDCIFFLAPRFWTLVKENNAWKETKKKGVAWPANQLGSGVYVDFTFSAVGRAHDRKGSREVYWDGSGRVRDAMLLTVCQSSLCRDGGHEMCMLYSFPQFRCVVHGLDEKKRKSVLSFIRMRGQRDNLCWDWCKSWTHTDMWIEAF